MLPQKFIIQFGSNFGLKILGMFAGIVVARIVGPEVIGTLSYGMAYVSLFSIVMGIFGTPHIKLVSEGKPIDKCIGTYYTLQFGSIFFYFMLTFGWFFIQKYILKVQFENNIIEVVIIVYIFKKALDKILIVSEDTFLAKMQQFKSNLPKLIMELLYHPGRIVIVLLGYRAITLASWDLLTTILVLPIVYKLLKRIGNFKYDKLLVKEYFKYAFPIALYMVLGILISQGDKLLLHFYTSTKELGYYSSAYSIGGFVLLLGNSVGQIFFPLFSDLITKNDWLTINDKIQKFHKLILVFILPSVCLIALFSEQLVTIFLGAQYQPSSIPFSIIAISSFFFIWFMPYGSVITGKGKFYLYALISGIKLLLFSFSITLLISPDFLNLGAIGVALNTLFMTFTEGGLYIYFSKRIGEINVNKIYLFVNFIIVCIVLVLFVIITFFNVYTNFIWLFIFLGFPGLIYLLLFKMKIFNYAYVKDSLNQFKPLLLKNYIKKEFKEK